MEQQLRRNSSHSIQNWIRYKMYEKKNEIVFPSLELKKPAILKACDSRIECPYKPRFRSRYWFKVEQVQKYGKEYWNRFGSMMSILRAKKFFFLAM